MSLAIHFGAATVQQEVPCNLPAEQQLLGTLMLNNDAIIAIRVQLKAEHFYVPLHREIFDGIETLIKAGRRADPVTVKQLVTEGMVGDMTISQYLARMVRDTVTVLVIDDYARAIIEAAGKRACIALGEKMVDLGYATDLSIIDEFDALRAKFESVTRALSGDEKAKTLADASRRSLASTALAYQGKGLSGVDYGIPFLMQMIGPLLSGQLIIMGGMTKHGKSSLIEQMVAGAAMNGHPVWVNSGEMKDEEARPPRPSPDHRHQSVAAGPRQGQRW
ncbi:hypothetical protein LZK73_18545 [Neorhizobium galegae]|nr:hypothetical protein LZK73_18545 [Neorhizobium galegae]